MDTATQPAALPENLTLILDRPPVVPHIDVVAHVALRGPVVLLNIVGAGDGGLSLPTAEARRLAQHLMTIADTSDAIAAIQAARKGVVTQ
ncbi:hypothetical protein [Derxia gummosa]|uniref:Uncharacterized protein n=1 Tax=Derxia gummosa DSM 723 TaxID=1121388 RepID=A0A8B6X3L8_9BURK|nr:hypothetical protein [Derxia gummosa]